MSGVQKNAQARGIAARIRLRYAREPMGRPPQHPRTYVTRHIRFRRPIDAGIRRAALEERRGFNQLVHLIVEDWLAARAARVLKPEPLAPHRRPRQARKSLSKP